jgi:tripartite-type tricarboxylate transporter receptor subunit TctC
MAIRNAHIAAAALGISALTVGAQAQTPAEFFRDKTLTIQVGYGAGGGYDMTTRIVARHLGKHIPGNPSVVVGNMPGAGSMRLVNFLYNAAPKDGLTLGVFGMLLMLEPLRGNQNMKAEPAKFEWIGSMHNDINACGIWKGGGVGIKTLDDLLKSQKTIVFGSTSPEAETATYPTILRKLLGAPVKVINGYKGTREINLAMQNGEVHGTCGMYESTVRTSYFSDLQSGDLTIFFQAGLDRKIDLFGTATSAGEILKDDETRQIGELLFRPSEITRPLAAPPGTPKDRVAALRKALADTMKDPATIEDGKKISLEFAPMPGERVAEIIEKFYKTPPHLVKRATELSAE